MFNKYKKMFNGAKKVAFCKVVIGLMICAVGSSEIQAMQKFQTEIRRAAQKAGKRANNDGSEDNNTKQSAKKRDVKAIEKAEKVEDNQVDQIGALEKKVAKLKNRVGQLESDNSTSKHNIHALKNKVDQLVICIGLISEEATKNNNQVINVQESFIQLINVQQLDVQSVNNQLF